MKGSGNKEGKGASVGVKAVEKGDKAMSKGSVRHSLRKGKPSTSTGKSEIGIKL